MPLFNTPHCIKTYSKTRHKDLCATTAFDKLLHDDDSSPVFITHSQSSFQPANGNLESNICKSNPGDKRIRSHVDLFSFSSDEDQSSKCKRRKDTTSQEKKKTIGDGQVQERVSVKSQKLKYKCFLTSSSSIERRLITSDNSKVITKQQELYSATANIPEEYLTSEDSQKQTVLESKSGCTVSSSKEPSLDKEHSKQIQQLLGLHQMPSENGILGKPEGHPDHTPESQELLSVKIQQFSSHTTTTTVDKKQSICLKSNIRNKDKQQTSDCDSYSFPDSDKSCVLTSLTLAMSKVTDDKPHEATVNDSDIPNSSRSCNDSSSCNKIKSPQENQLQAKTFVDKLSKLLAGKKSLVNEALPCLVPTTCQTSVISVGSSGLEVPSQKSLSTHDIFREHVPASSHHFGLHKDSCQILPLATSLHSNSLTHVRHFLLPSALAEHNYFHCLEHDEKITNDHSYSLLSLPEEFTIPKSVVALPVDFSVKLSQQSGDSITGIQTLSIPLGKDTNQSYEDTKFSSKQLKLCNLYKDSDLDNSCSVLLLSPWQETPSQSASPNGKVSENFTTDNSLLHSHNNDSSCKTAQEVNTYKHKGLKGKIMLKKESLKSTMKDIHLSNSVTLEDFGEKFCETSGENYFTKCLETSKSALTHGNNDPVQSQPILLMDFDEQTLTEPKRKQLQFNCERFSSCFPMQNSRQTPEAFPDSHADDAVNPDNSDNKHSIHLGNTLTKNSTFQGRSTAMNSTDIQTKFVKRAADRRTPSDAVCGDFKTDITQDTTHRSREVENSTSGSQKSTTVHVAHHTTELGSHRTKTNERHVKRGNQTVVQLRKGIKSPRRPEKTGELKSSRASDNIVKIQDHYVFDTELTGAADALSKRTCDSNLLPDNPQSKQKTPEKISTLSEYTHENSVRRLLKSPLKMSNKAKAVYNPRQWLHPTKDEELADSTKGRVTKAVSTLESYDFSTCDDSSPVLSRISSWPKRLQGDDVVKVQVSKDQKPLFTVVHNVKEAHECQEYGEKQEFQDDVDYMLDGLQCSQPLATRCLSTLSLASKCMVPAFRMHLRAHGILTKILEALHDAPDFVSLSLCLSALLFTMSRDRLAIELDDFSVRLILRLLDADSANDDTSAADELERIRLKVSDICTATIHSSKTPHVKLKPCDMTTGYLGMQLLLTLTSKHTADWFKETLRSHGGLKHIINAACHCVDEIVKLCPGALSSNLHLYIRSEKCLKVLDNVTYMCTENQSFLLEYRSSMLIEALNSLLSICIRDLASEGRVASYQSCSEDKVNKDCPQFLVSTCLLTLLRLLLNITHESERGCFVIGQQKNLLFSVLSSVLSTPAAVCTVHQFDLSILGLSLLMNLVENCEANRKNFIRLKTHVPNNADTGEEISALESLGILFSQSFKAARLIEEAHDEKIEAAEKQQKLAANSVLSLGSAFHSPSAEIDQSGQWVESEFGLQWVAKEEKEDIQEVEELCPERLKASPNRLDSQETPSSSQDDTDNYTRDLHTAGKHMEDSFVAAYTAVLIGSIIQHDVNLAEAVRKTLPEFSFIPLVRMIRKFLGFMNFTNLTSASGSKTFQHVLKILESCQSNAVTYDGESSST